METTKPSFGALWRIADEVMETVFDAPEGAPERAMVRDFEARGYSPEMFYRLVAELESAGLVRSRSTGRFELCLTEAPTA
jgi:hypothetical protein